MKANSYVFTRILSIPLLRGFFPFYRAKTIVDPVRVAKGKKLIWRNDFGSTTQITNAYMDRPVELGNLLYMRTREREFIRSRIYRPSESVKGKNPLVSSSHSKYLKVVESELFEGFGHLKTLLEELNETKDLDIPVSFASNTLYSMEKNGLRNEEMYRKIIFPILKAKAQYLHADGLAGAIWALGQYESKDSELISTLLKNYESRTFGTDLVYVKNLKLSMDAFASAEGSHTFERNSTPEIKNLFINGHLACLELYDGLQNLSTQTLDSKTSKRVNEVLGNLKERQSITSDSYSIYKQLRELPKSS